MATDTITVSTQKELLAALKTAQGGETILLEDGDYGSVFLSRLYQKSLGTYDSPVTIKSINPQGATFSSIEMRYAQNVNIDGIEVEGTLKVWMKASDIEITNTKAEYLYMRDIDGLSLTNSEAGGGRFGLLMYSVKNFDVSHNYFHEVTEDVVRIVGDTSKGTFANNILWDTIAAKPTHADLLQMFEMDDKTPHDIVIRNNLFYDDPDTGINNAQGLFLIEPGSKGYRNITVDENLFSTNHNNTIYVKGGVEGIDITHNTLLGDQWDVEGLIRLAYSSLGNGGVTVEGNFARGVRDETGDVTVGDNHLYGSGASWVVKSDPDSFFNDPDAADWTAFLPVKDSEIDLPTGMGAAAFLKKLLAGTASLGLQDVPAALALGATPGTPAAEVEPVYSYAGKTSFSGAWSGIVTQENDPALHIDQGTILIDFNADTFGWRRGLFSLDAAGTDNGFSAWIQEGVLKVTFEDDDSVQTVSSSALDIHTDHSLQITFGDGVGHVWLDGNRLGSVKTDMDWTGNDEQIVIGGQNAESAAGTVSGRQYAFDGDITDIQIYDHAMTPTEYGLLA